MPGGVTGGIVGGLPESPAPPPSEPLRVAANRVEGTPITRVNPVYPEAAVRAHLEGSVVVDVLVGRDGKPLEVRMLRPLPFLDKSAVEAVKQWRWRPFLFDGQAVPFWVTITVDFKLTPARRT